MAKKTISNYLFQMITDERYGRQKYAFLEECKNTKIVKLWKILFETDMRETELLETRIFEFGSMIKEDDIWGREIFVCLVALLNLVIK